MPQGEKRTPLDLLKKIQEENLGASLAELKRLFREAVRGDEKYIAPLIHEVARDLYRRKNTS